MKLYELSASMSESLQFLLVPIATFSIVCLRAMYYGGKRWYTVVIEGLLFAIVSRVLLPVATDFYITVMGIKADSAFDYAFLTCISIGFVGIEAMSNVLNRWVNNPLPKKL